ncbi:MAG TPA: aminotransferase class I/II-fold pyridoxal phosphate-dependent enzyme [Nitrospiraceae bacterium]|nr:aminotransferase class I/II-fold pyridoxal phosphate-dependent enzyme [Nitrospiraceae bacterium]
MSVAPKYPVLRPRLPTADKLLPYLERIDTARWYTNGGPVLKEFEQKLADHFGVSEPCLVTSANATLAISQALRAVARPTGGLCVMPSWTFVASAAAAVWAGLEPYFIDISEDSWTIRPEDVLRLSAERPISAVLVVASFGAPLDLQEWDEFTRKSGIPVVVDAAGGFDAFRAEGGGWESEAPVVISLHATKVFGVGEGAAVIAKNQSLAQRIARFGNFGFQGSRVAELPGTNAKMTEYSAAIGLAQFAEWPNTRNAWRRVTEAFVQEVGRVDGVRLAPQFGEGWVSSFGMVQFDESIPAEDVSAFLEGEGIETRQWWGKGCHCQRAYDQYPRSPLPVTRKLGQQVLGLPFWLGLESDDIISIASVLEEAIASARAGQEVPRTMHGSIGSRERYGATLKLAP